MNKSIINPNKFVVLIVDDNRYFVDRMISLLDDIQNIRYINVASDYDEANRLLNNERHDLVLLDINLPGKNGIELLKQIRKSERQSKVIMITNHTDDYYRQQCKDLGADHFLDKSNDFAKVPDIISELEVA